MAGQSEYKSVLCGGGDNMEVVLSPLGAQGWEAVGFVPVTHRAANTWTSRPDIEFVTEWGATQYRVLLKRRKP